MNYTAEARGDDLRRPWLGSLPHAAVLVARGGQRGEKLQVHGGSVRVFT